jgi:hypothetical protein
MAALALGSLHANFRALRGDSKEALLSPLYTPPDESACHLWEGDAALCPEVEACI